MKYTINDRKIFPKSIGVYKISFINNNGKVYIGSTSNKNGFYKRWCRHILELSKNISKSPALQNATNKYGVDNMRFEVIEECNYKDCIKKEQYYINEYNSFNFGYNSRPFASTNLELKYTQEHKNNISKAHKLKRDKYFEIVKNLYFDNLSIKNISIKLEVSCEFITRILKENNITIRNNKGIKNIEIYQYDIFGNYIKKFNSIRECARDMNVDTQSINNVLQNKCKHSKNYYYSLYFLEKNEIENNIKKLNLNLREYVNIKQIDENKKTVKIWNNIKEIKKYNETLSIQMLRKALSKKIKYKGFYWIV
jgi:group I intron endonuclease